jgi:hypothetical protein
MPLIGTPTRANGAWSDDPPWSTILRARQAAAQHPLEPARAVVDLGHRPRRADHVEVQVRGHPPALGARQVGDVAA